MAPEMTPAGRRLECVPENRFQVVEGLPLSGCRLPEPSKEVEEEEGFPGFAPEEEFPEMELRLTGRGVAPADISHSVKTG